MSTDRERAGQELREVERQVTEAFENPESLSPAIGDSHRRPRLRIWARPAFENHCSFAIWGGKAERGRVRRIELRRDVDVDRADPIKRMAMLGEAEVLQRDGALQLDGGHFGIEVEDVSASYRFESMDPCMADLCDWIDDQLSAGG